VSIRWVGSCRRLSGSLPASRLRPAGARCSRRTLLPGERPDGHGEQQPLELRHDTADDLARIVRPATARKIAARLRGLGYLWTAHEIEGYRMGSMNAVLGVTTSKE